ncbi:MAG: hypothetical protein WC720_05070 [Candidatus Shapirobacteria bacterium]|jgi:hypothetical protein
MTLIASKLCKYIVPDSFTNPNAEAYEYYLVWIGVDGGVYSWLFEDYTLNKDISGEIVNKKSENITNLFKESNRTIKLVAEDLTENEFDVISDITRAIVIRRYFKDGSYKSLAISTNTVEKPKSQFRYNFEIEVQEVEDKLMR